MDYVITDSNVSPLIASIPEAAPWISAPRFVIPAGEEHKTPATLAVIWEWLADEGANRESRIVNIGGGMVSDIGGFAAATFMRGIDYINLPTTLLAAVDAAVGGKTAVNVGELKNQAGAFRMPSQVVFSSAPFATLSRQELLSGMGEMLKYGLISSPGLYLNLRRNDLFLDRSPALLPFVKECVSIKERIAAEDPTERGVRKILNFGHTAGHAFESLSLARGAGLPHGIAVAHGLMVALILSHTVEGYPSKELYTLAEVLKNFFPPTDTACRDNDALIGYMLHDKKNSSRTEVRFSLLSDIATPKIDVAVSREEISTALDIYRDLV